MFLYGKSLTIDDIDELTHIGAQATQHPSMSELKLVNRSISLKYCEYKISNTENKMLQAESIAISNKGVFFNSLVDFKLGNLLRIWIELPNYWAKKSRLVDYQHTNAPNYFQILSRVIKTNEALKRGNIFQILCENLVVDPIDEAVLENYIRNPNED